MGYALFGQTVPNPKERTEKNASSQLASSNIMISPYKNQTNDPINYLT